MLSKPKYLKEKSKSLKPFMLQYKNREGHIPP